MSNFSSVNDPTSDEPSIVQRQRTGDWLLRVQRTHELETRVLQGNGEFSIGRAGDIAISEPAVSRLHAKITWNRSGVSITDLNSTHRTFLDDHPLIPNRVTLLKPGQQVFIGTACLYLRPEYETIPRFHDTPHNTQEEANQSQCSPAMREMYQAIKKLAMLPRTIHLFGETGVGKLRLAEHIHRISRAGGSIRSVNAAALPRELFESELFGHVKGAFANATSTHVGLIEMANGGTFFLDEIADLELSLQAKLLKAIEEQKIRPVGANQDRPINVRFITASNKDLRTMVKSGQFRADLLYRLNSTVRIPPLRERKSEILYLAGNFLRSCAQEQLIKPVPVLDQDAQAWLLDYKWPGNVRELKTCMERLLALSSGRNTLTLSELIAAQKFDPAYEEANSPPPAVVVGDGLTQQVQLSSLREGGPTLNDVALAGQRQFIVETLQKTRENVTAAAKLCGVSRSTLNRKIGEYQIPIRNTKEAPPR